MCEAANWEKLLPASIMGVNGVVEAVSTCKRMDHSAGKRMIARSNRSSHATVQLFNTAIQKHNLWPSQRVVENQKLYH